MAWNKQDRSFKILIGKKLTDSNKAYYEELGASTLSIYFDNVKTDVVPTSPSQGIAAGIVKLHTKLALTREQTVADNQCYYAQEGGVPLTDWIDTQRGAAYEVALYNNGVQIPITDNSQWFFDYQTGILTFNGVATGFNNLQLTGYRYIGAKGTLDGANAVFPMTYAQAEALRSANKLKVGCQYVITDFQTIHLIPGTIDSNNPLIKDINNIHVGAIEVLVLTANSANGFDRLVRSPANPQDILHYNFLDSMCEDNTTPRKGKITYRKDSTLQVATHYDWREVRFRRWFAQGAMKPLYTFHVVDGIPSYDSYTDYTTFNFSRQFRDVYVAAYGTDYNNIVFADVAIAVTLNGICSDSTFLDCCESVNVKEGIFNVTAYHFFTNNNINRLRYVEFNSLTHNNILNNIHNTTFLSNCLANRFNSEIAYCTFNQIEKNTVNGEFSDVIAQQAFSYSVVNSSLNSVEFNDICNSCVFNLPQNSVTYNLAIEFVSLDSPIDNVVVDEQLLNVSLRKSNTNKIFKLSITHDGNLTTEPLITADSVGW